jgi:hypothetical protein
LLPQSDKIADDVGDFAGRGENFWKNNERHQHIQVRHTQCLNKAEEVLYDRGKLLIRHHPKIPWRFS